MLVARGRATASHLLLHGTSSRPGFRDVFGLAEFRALWLAQMLSASGDQLARVALTVLVYDRTRSALLAAVTFAASVVPTFVGGIAVMVVPGVWRGLLSGDLWWRFWACGCRCWPMRRRSAAGVADGLWLTFTSRGMRIPMLFGGLCAFYELPQGGGAAGPPGRRGHGHGRADPVRCGAPAGSGVNHPGGIGGVRLLPDRRQCRVRPGHPGCAAQPGIRHRPGRHQLHAGHSHPHRRRRRRTRRTQGREPSGVIRMAAAWRGCSLPGQVWPGHVRRPGGAGHRGFPGLGARRCGRRLARRRRAGRRRGG